MNASFDRSYTDNILPPRLENYMKELDSDIKLNEANIHDKTMLKPSIAAKWARFSYEEEQYKKKMMKTVEDLKLQVAEKLYEKKRDAVINQKINDTVMKMEVERTIRKSTQYLKIKEEIELQDDILRFITEAKQIISSFGFDIKNAIDVLKLENI